LKEKLNGNLPVLVMMPVIVFAVMAMARGRHLGIRFHCGQIALRLIQ
jgi:hypothetical protein